MESVVRAVILYGFLLLVLRFSGKRTLAQITPFDLVLLLIISEAAQNGLVGNDYSLTNSIVIITTLIGIDISLSLLKQRSRQIARLLDDGPLIVVRNGRLMKDRAMRERVDESDVLMAARHLHGIERLDQIKYAVLENTGEISIIPKPGAANTGY
jgi:uncharacterized membrane protein YcaP (DUF421 family)